MKEITKYIVAGYVLAFLFACEKPKTHTYSGRLLHSCENPTPVAHQKIYLVHDNFPALWNTDQYGVIAETETDSAGYFTFTFEEITKKGYFNIQRDKVNYRLAGWGYPAQSAKDLIVYYEPPIYVNVHVSILNPQLMGNEIDSIMVSFYEYGNLGNPAHVFQSFDSNSVTFKAELIYSSIHPEVYNLNGGGPPSASYHSYYTIYVKAMKENALPKTVEMYEYYYGAPCGDMYYTMDLAEVAAYFQ